MSRAGNYPKLEEEALPTTVYGMHASGTKDRATATDAHHAGNCQSVSQSGLALVFFYPNLQLDLVGYFGHRVPLLRPSHLFKGALLRIDLYFMCVPTDRAREQQKKAGNSGREAMRDDMMNAEGGRDGTLTKDRLG